MDQKEPLTLDNTICYGQEFIRKSHQDFAIRFVTAKNWPEKATKTRQYDVVRRHELERATKIWQYDLLRLNMGQKELPRLGSTICYGQELARNSQYDLLRPRIGQKEPARFGSAFCYRQTWPERAKSWPEKAAKTRQYDLIRPRVGKIEPLRIGSTIYCGQT